MSIFFSLGSIIFGLILLTVGGNLLVDGAVSLARKWRVSDAIIGLTIVAIGTSMPELVVSVMASISGSPDLAIGNVLGSNISNVFLILGITACLAPITLSRATRYFDLPVNIFVTLFLALIVSDILIDGASSRLISRTDGIVLMIFAVMYILYSLKHNNLTTPTEIEEVDNILAPAKATLWVVGGMAVLFFGGKILVDGSVELAKIAGLSESVIGLTIVAIGTSMPELITSVIATRRHKADIALGNVIGSSIMNVLVILGVSAFVAPLPFQATSYIDLLMALLGPILVIILSFVWTRNRLERREGIILVTLYVLYLTYLILREVAI